MKKLFCILSILTIISPVFADDDPPAVPVAGDPGATTTITDLNRAENAPGYSLKTGKTTDSNAASAGYVKGAYNATIKAVNMVADQKQNKLNSDSTKGAVNVVTSGSGALVNGVSANPTTQIVTISKAEVTIPIGAEPSGTVPNGRAPIWIE